MNPQNIAILAGLAVGGFVGYSYAGKLVAYPPYAQILGLIRGGQPVVAVVQTPTLGQQITGAAGAVGGVIHTVTDALSALQGAFGWGSSTSDSSGYSSGGDGGDYE